MAGRPNPHHDRRDEDDLLLLAALRHDRRRSSRRRTRTSLLVAGALALVLTAAGIAAVSLVPKVLGSTCGGTRLYPIAVGESSIVYASDGSRLGVIPSAQNRQPLHLRQISRWLPLATVAVEDRRFWEHGALDYGAIVRASWRNLMSGRVEEGASTLTQQLARNLYIGSQQRSLRRKVEEACVALRLQQRLSRREILADYLNVVYYGNRAFGAEAAAQTYFSRNAWELTLPQAALLAGLPQAPSIYDPFDFPSAAVERRNEVLTALLDQGKITRAQFGWASSRPLQLKPGHLYTTIRQPTFFGYVQQQLAARFGDDAVRSGGLRVRTTIDPRLENLANQALRGVLQDRNDPAAALVAIDPANGHVRAMRVIVPADSG